MITLAAVNFANTNFYLLSPHLERRDRERKHFLICSTFSSETTEYVAMSESSPRREVRMLPLIVTPSTYNEADALQSQKTMASRSSIRLLCKACAHSQWGPGSQEMGVWSAWEGQDAVGGRPIQA